MSFWLLTTALGNLVVSQLFKLNVKGKGADGSEILHYSGAEQFFLFAGGLAVVGVVFVFVALAYQYRDRTQSAGLQGAR